MPDFDPVNLIVLPGPPSSVVASHQHQQPAIVAASASASASASLASAAVARLQSANLLPRAGSPVASSAGGQPPIGHSGDQLASGTGSQWEQQQQPGPGVARKRRRPNVPREGMAEAATAGSGSGPVPVGPIVVPSLGRPHRVVVVGAGFAGIGAALELQRLGIEVVVLEVRNADHPARARTTGMVFYFGCARGPGHYLTVLFAVAWWRAGRGLFILWASLSSSIVLLVRSVEGFSACAAAGGIDSLSYVCGRETTARSDPPLAPLMPLLPPIG